MSTEDKLNEQQPAPQAAEPEKEPPTPEEPEAPAPKAKETKAEKKAAKKEAKAQESKAAEEAAKLAGELAALNDKYLRVCAEYDNFRRRSQKEREALYADVKADTLTKFLPVYDNLERALKQSTEDEAYRKGVEMIMAQFNSTLEKLGVTKLDCLGQTFDPGLHNAVMHVEDETASPW